MRDWYTAQELAGLPGVPGTVQGLNYRAKQEQWTCRARAGKGGGREYAFVTLPPETQAALLAAQVNAEPAVVPAPVTAPAPVVVERDKLPASRLWVQLLAAEVARSNRTRAGARIGISRSAVSLALVNRYPSPSLVRRVGGLPQDHHHRDHPQYHGRCLQAVAAGLRVGQAAL
ncbi:Mu DNA-binding domain protein [compost metagenome]